MPARPHCAAYLAMSIDGYIARPDGGLDWLEPMHAGGIEYGYDAFFAGVDALVIGRNTYDVVCGFAEWPYGQKRLAVLTHRPPAPRHGETFHDRPLRAVLGELAQGGARRVYVDGGAVVREALREELLDELTISFVPRLLGRGIRLFEEPGVDRVMALEASRAFATGLVQNVYRPR